MTYTEATEAIKRMPLVPVRPAAWPRPKTTADKQRQAWLACRTNPRGKQSCGLLRSAGT